MSKRLHKTTIVLIFLIMLNIPFILGYTIYNGTAGNNVIFRSSGLNSSVSLTFSLNFSRVDIYNNSIAFYNLTYIHSSACSISNISLYNLTDKNSSILTSSFNYTPCLSPLGFGGGGGAIIPIEENETYCGDGICQIINSEDIKEDWFNCKDDCKIYKIEYLLLDCFNSEKPCFWKNDILIYSLITFIFCGFFLYMMILSKIKDKKKKKEKKKK